MLHTDDFNAIKTIGCSNYTYYMAKCASLTP